MATLGQELREERERRTISIKEISDQTKIGTRILVALENDRWDLMPQKFFLKGVIKSYVQAIGADPDVFLAKYDEQRGIRAEPADKDRSVLGRKKHEFLEEIELESEKPPARKRIFRIILVLLFLIPAFAVYWFFLKPENAPLPKVPASEASQPSPAVTAPADAQTEEQEPKAIETGLRLEFRFQAESWMHVIADGVAVLDGIRPAGSTASLRAEREFVIQTGNAGGFDFTLNGRPGRSLGKPGAVLTDIRITTANVATFLKEEKPAESGTGER